MRARETHCAALCFAQLCLPHVPHQWRNLWRAAQPSDVVTSYTTTEQEQASFHISNTTRSSSSQLLFTIGWWRGVVVNALVVINKGTLHWARLVLGWVTICGRMN